jgi:hypothetical protein
MRFRQTGVLLASLLLAVSLLAMSASARPSTPDQQTFPPFTPPESIAAVACTGSTPATVGCGIPTARCNNGQYSCSQNASGTCSSNGGVDCWICPGLLCPNTCLYSLSSSGASIAAGGSSGSVSVTGTTGCNWTAVSNANFISVTGGSNGNGNGTVSYTVASHSSSSQRSGTITIAGRTFTVTQAGVTTCSYTLSSSAVSVAAAATSGSVSLTTTSGCGWTAVSSAAFVTVTSGSSGTGSATVNYSVAANSSASSRSGTIIIGGHSFTVNQSAPAAPTLTTHPQSQTIAFAQTPAALSAAATGIGTLSYQWYRGACGASASVGAATASSYSPPALTSNTRYWVSVSNVGGTTNSNTATMTVAFTNDPLGNGLVRVAHITELRTRIDALRACYGLASYDYADPSLQAGTTAIRSQHLVDLRQALHAVYVAAALATPNYTDADLGAGHLVKAAHVAELRAAVTALE